MTAQNKATEQAQKTTPKKKRTSVTTAQAAKVLKGKDLKILLTQSHASLDVTTDTDFIKSMKPAKSELKSSSPAEHIRTVEDRHAWAIFLDDDLITKRVCANGDTEKYLIGYLNGKTARKNETHFSQKETDPFAHRIIFQPAPSYVSYSFFYGFFYSTIRHICLQTIYGEGYKKKKNLACNGVSITKREQILKKFEDKYTFDFAKGSELDKLMHEYASTLVENIVEICEKLGAPTNELENEIVEKTEKQRRNDK